MKKKHFTLIILFTFFLTGCLQNTRVVHQSAETPQLVRSPLQGRWIVTKVVHSIDEEDSMNQLIGKDAIFSPSVVIFHTQLIEEPKYSMTKVNTDHFLNLRYNKSRKELGVTADKLFLIGIYVGDEEYFEVLREKEDVAYIDIYGNILQLIKTKEDISDNQVEILRKSTSEEQKYRSSAIAN